MKRTLLVLGMVLALAMTAMANVEPTSIDAEITSPTAGEVIYENALSLAAFDPSVAQSTEDLDWAVVTDDGIGAECTGEIHFNRNNSAYDYEAGVFGAELDISSLQAGEYCFVFNTYNRNAPDGVRLVQWFYIVDDYVLVDASIDEALDTYAPDTRQPDYSVSGVVGLYGSDGLAGELELRYHNEKITCHVDLSTGTAQLARYGPDLDPDPDRVQMRGVDYDCNNGDGGAFALVQILEPGFEGPNGAFFVSEDGGVSGSGDYDLVGTFDNSRDWVPLDRGETYFEIAAFS